MPGGGVGLQINASGSNCIRVVFAAAATACWSTRFQSTANMNLLSTDFRIKPKKPEINVENGVLFFTTCEIEKVVVHLSMINILPRSMNANAISLG